MLCSSSRGNGVGGYCGLKATEDGNIITFSDTTTGPDTMFYQPGPFIGYPHVQGMYPYDKEHWAQEQCLYLISALKKSCGVGWDYSVKFTNDYVLTTKPQLPIQQFPDGTPVIDSTYAYHEDGFIPDWTYMAEYIQHIEQESMLQLRQYLDLSGLADYDPASKDAPAPSKSGKKPNHGLSLIPPKKMEAFQIGNLFTVFTGRDVIIGGTKDGPIPLISHQNTENGVVKTIKEIPNRKVFDHTKTIALADRGVFYATYQDRDFHIGTRVKALVAKFDTKPKEVMLYIVTSINKLQVFYTDYSVNATDKVPILNIQLPVQTDKQGRPIVDMSTEYHEKGYIPDWDYMEQYIRTIEKMVMTDVISFNNAMAGKTPAQHKATLQ